MKVDDTISRQAAIDAECEVCQIAPKRERGHNCIYYVHGCKEIECLRALPPAQPRITDEQAIEHLRSTGWMQNHDREMYDMGLKEQLADDSGSYDSLLPSAQPERKKGKWKRKIVDSGFNADWICSECGHRLKTEYATNYCPNCGADMRGEENGKNK